MTDDALFPSDYDRIFVIDVETAGLDERESPLLEIGVEHLETGWRASWPVRAPRGWRLVQWWPWLAKKLGLWIDPVSMNVNGLDPGSGMRLENALRGFMAFCLLRYENTKPRWILAGMNPGFDLRFLRGAFARVGWKFPFSHRSIDLHTLMVQQALLIGSGETICDLTTDEIYERLGLEPEAKPHTALEGVRREAEVFRLLLGDYD